MANAIYPLTKQAFLSPGSGSIDLSADTIRLALVLTAYTFSAAHQFFSDLGTNVVGGQAGISGNQPFTSKTVTNGVFNGASPLTFTAITGTQISYLVGFKDTTVAGTSRLIFFIDTATGLPITPNGGNITVTLDTGANKIFAL